MGQLGLKCLLLALKSGDAHDVVRWVMVIYSALQVSQLAPETGLAALRGCFPWFHGSCSLLGHFGAVRSVWKALLLETEGTLLHPELGRFLDVYDGAGDAGLAIQQGELAGDAFGPREPWQRRRVGSRDRSTSNWPSNTTEYL